MAYMNQDRKQVISAAVKPILAKYGMKGTLRTDRLSITLTLQSGPIDFIGAWAVTPSRAQQKIDGYADEAARRTQYHFVVSQYDLNRNYTGTALAFLEEIVTALRSADWYDRSDIMADYFDTAYYFHINVGKWGKPYVLTPVYTR